jgi:ribosomal protein S18 acetylase RimI-like enzyme
MMSAHDLQPLRDLVGRLQDFTREEQQVALELIDEAAKKNPEYEVMVALEGDTLAGYVCFGKTPMTQATYDLYWLGVCPAQRKRGLGRALVDALSDQLTQRNGLLVRVETSSREAYGGTIDFYNAAGFAETARVPRFYAADDDLLIFTRALSAEVSAAEVA